MPEPSNVLIVQTIDDLLNELADELHGRKSAFSEAQKIRHLNKAVNALWKIFKTLHRGYFVVKSQNTTPGADDYFGPLDTSALEYALPKNFAEMRFIEVTAPVDYANVEFVRVPMNAPLFGAERRGDNSSVTADSLVPGEMHYDITGPDASGFQTFIIARRAPIAMTLVLRYVRFVPRFTIPKSAAETLAAVMSPFTHELITYAAKSLLKSEEEADSADFVKWEQTWRSDIERTVQAADERASADVDLVEEFEAE